MLGLANGARPQAAAYTIITISALLGACGPNAPMTGTGSASGTTLGDPTTGESTGADGPVDEELWRLSLDAAVKTTPPVGDGSGSVYVIATREDPTNPSGPDRVSLFKISNDGQIAWELGLGTSNDNAALAVAAQGEIWTCVGGAVSRVAPDGALRWARSDSCTGSRSIAVGGEVSVSVHLRPQDGGAGGHVLEVVALDGLGARLWARDVGVRPAYEKNVPYVATEVAGAAISGTSVYVGCDTCSASPAIVELGLSDGSVRGIGALEGTAWTMPRRTTFERPRVTADAVWLDAYEDAIDRRAWRWSAGSAAMATNDSLPIEGPSGSTQRIFDAEAVAVTVGGMTRVVDMGAIEIADRAALQNGEPAALALDGSVLMVSVPEPLLANPRARSCWEQACRVYVVDPLGQVSWVLGEDVVRLPYVGDGRIVYVASNGDLVAHTAPLAPSTFIGWGQWLANREGNSCRDCAGG